MESKLKIRQTPREDRPKKGFCSKEILRYGMLNEVDIDSDRLEEMRKIQEAKDRKENPEKFKKLELEKKRRETRERKAANEELNRIEARKAQRPRKKVKKRSKKKVSMRQSLKAAFESLKKLYMNMKLLAINQANLLRRNNTENNDVQSYIDFSGVSLGTAPPRQRVPPKRNYRPLSKTRNSENTEALRRLRRNMTEAKKRHRDVKLSLKKYQTDPCFRDLSPSIVFDDEFDLSSVISEASSLMTIEKERGVLLD